MFKANFENLLDSYHALMGGGGLRPGEGGSVTRGGTKEIDAARRIQGTAYRAEKGSSVYKALFDLSNRWQEIPNLELRQREVGLSSREINQQLSTVGAAGGGESPDAEELADVIALDAVTAGI